MESHVQPRETVVMWLFDLAPLGFAYKGVSYFMALATCLRLLNKNKLYHMDCLGEPQELGRGHRSSCRFSDSMVEPYTFNSCPSRLLRPVQAAPLAIGPLRANLDDQDWEAPKNTGQRRDPRRNGV